MDDRKVNNGITSDGFGSIELYDYPISFNPDTTWIQKTGSKAFCNIITKTIEVKTEWVKEPFFFCQSFIDKPYGSGDYKCHTRLVNYVQDSLYLDGSTNPNFQKAIYFSHADYTDLISPLDAKGLPYLLLLLVRDPITRVISEFKHFKDGCTGRWDYSPADGSCDKDEEITKESFLKYLSYDGNDIGMFNRETRVIAGYDNCPDFAEMEECFKIAKGVIDRAHFVGLTEQMDQTLLLYKEMFGMHDQHHIIQQQRVERNDGKIFFEIDDEVEQKILEKNSWDHKLFKYAEIKFHMLWVRYLKNSYRQRAEIAS